MNDVTKSYEAVPPPVTDQSTPTQSKRSWVQAVAIVLVCLLALGGLAWYLSHRNARQGPPGGANRARPTATVAFAVVKRADVPLRLQALGTVAPIAVATVRPQVSGVLSKIFYLEGQLVKQGEPLVEIDPRPFQLSLDQARGQLLRDQAELANAKAILERDRVLLNQDSIAQQDVDTQAATVRQLEAAIAADRASVGTAQLNLSYSKVTAPISGRVGLRPVDIGNYVSTGDTAGVATITQVAPIDVTFALPSDTVTPIQQRTSSGATLPTTVLDRTRTITLGQGTFLTLDNQIDSQTGTIKAKARFDNEKGTLFPNQFVNVQVQLDTVGNALVVPANAIRHGPKGEFVYVIAQDKTAHVRLIKTGPATDELTSVTAGLNAGERVVTEGGDRLTDGSVVRLPGERGRGPPAQGKNAGGAQYGKHQPQAAADGASDSGPGAETRDGSGGQHNRYKHAADNGVSGGGQGAEGQDASGGQRNLQKRPSDDGVSDSSPRAQSPGAAGAGERQAQGGAQRSTASGQPSAIGVPSPAAGAQSGSGEHKHRRQHAGAADAE